MNKQSRHGLNVVVFSRGAWQHAATVADVLAAALIFGVLVIGAAASAPGIRKNSKETRCLMNLAQTGLASSIYSAQDKADMALPVHPLQVSQDPNNPTFIGAYEWGGKSGTGWDDWLGPSNVLNSKYGTKAGFGPGTRPLNTILYPQSFPDNLHPTFNPTGAFSDSIMELEIQHCPADTGYAGVHFPTFRDSKLSSYDHFGTSYAANVFSYSDGSQVYSNSPYLRPLADILSPGTTIAYYENNGRYAWAAGDVPECDLLGTRPPGLVRGWHGKYWLFKALFVDGHTDTIPMRGFTFKPLPYYPDFSPDFSCDAIIRGEG